MEYTITVEKRTETGKDACEALRNAGKIPGVVYGKGKEAQIITLNLKSFEELWREAGETKVIHMVGLDKEIDVLIQDVALDPYYDVASHVDFYVVEKNVAVDVEVPLVFVGVSPAEKSLGGTLIKVMHTMNIEALPKDLPSEVEVDISALATFEDQILVKDVVLPKGVHAIDEENEVVAIVQEPKADDGTAGSVDISSVEVVKKGKEVEGDVK